MRKQSYILYMLLIFFVFQSSIYAWNGTITTPNTGEGSETLEKPVVDLGVIGEDSSGNTYSCKYKYDINISNFNVKNVENMIGMFANCSNLDRKSVV